MESAKSRCSQVRNPFDYDVPPASQEELMVMVHPFEKFGKNKKGKEPDALAKWAKFTRANNVFIWIFLATCGVVATLWIESLDLIIRHGIFRLRDDHILNKYEHYGTRYLVYIGWTITLSLTSCLLVKLFCYPYAAGSGVPELKSMLSGFFNKEAMSVKVLIVKSLALVLAYGSGLSVGKEGPYVHLAACVANALLCFRPFSKDVAGNETKRSMMLGACSALGIAATFGSPIGGVLFSIEVTSTYYLINNYWRSFFTCAVGAVAIKIILSQQHLHLLEDFRTDLPVISNLFGTKLIAFILVGISCGFLSSLFIYMYTKLVLLKKRYSIILKRITPYGEVIIVAFVTALISFPLYYLRLDHASAVHSLFTNNNIEVWYDQIIPNTPYKSNTTIDILPNPQDTGIDTTPGSIKGAIILATLVYTIIKLCLTTVSITLPIPYGIYIPLFAIGAAFGRACGEIFTLLFPGEGILPNGFAAIGAAALCGGATRTISSAVIILELTNDMNYFIPILLAVTISTGLGNVMNHSIYDVFLRNKGLPYLPFLRVKGDSIVAHDIMNREPCFVTQRITVDEIQNTLITHKDDIIPIVETKEKMHLVGVIQRKTLKRVVNYHQKLASASLGSPTGMAEMEMIEIEKENEQLLEEMEKSSETYVPSPVGVGLLPPPSASSTAPSENTSLEAPLDLLSLPASHPWVLIDPSPFQLTENTPIRKILFMFSMLGGHVLYVTYKGKLVGSITKQSLVLRLSPPPTS